MSVPSITGVELAGDAGLPLLLLGPSLGTSARSLWEEVAQRLGSRFHVVGWELPGHAGAPTAEPFTLAELAAGVLAWAEEVGRARGRVGPFAYAGVSVGGAVGFQLLLDAPARLGRVALLCTAPRIGIPAGWHERAALVRAEGTRSMVAGSAERWFGAGFAERQPAVAAGLLDALRGTDAEGYAQVCDALAGFDVADRIRVEPTADPAAAPGVDLLLVAGADDVVCPPGDLAALAGEPTGARTEVLDGVGHLAPAEAPAEVARLLTAHLAPGTTLEELRHAGSRVRRTVLGDAHVDRAEAAVTPVTADFQELITHWAWGSVWTRPGLDRRSRSMITLTALIARGHLEELAMHVRAALRNGLTEAEIAEVVLQSAVYCGVPDANAAFRVVQEALAPPRE